ncbi:MAG: glycosyltransferase family 4 protein, partial [Mycobacteriales bacterium]
LGRLDEPRKGLATLLEALPALLADHPGVRLLVAGPGDPDYIYERLPAGLESSLTLLGRVSEADKPRVYASSDVFVAPHTGGESFGIVLLEAMAAGRAVVASDLAAFRAVLGGGLAGRLVPPGEPAALAKAIGDLLDDPAQRSRLAAAAAEEVERYDWTVVTKEVLAVYEMVTAAGIHVSPEPVAKPGLLRDVP